MLDKLDILTHANLLQLLPFGCAYTTDVEGNPCINSLRFAMAMRALYIHDDILIRKALDIN
jgi:hypothetical protein